MARTWGALAALLCSLAPAGAHATTMQLPASRLNVDLPSQFTVVGATNFMDLVHVDTTSSKGDISIGRWTVSCATLWQNSADGLQTTFYAWTPSWMPYGWEGKTWDGNQYAACKSIDGYSIGVQMMSDDVASWTSSNELVNLLYALDYSWSSERVAEHDTPVRLPGSGLSMELPYSFYLDTASPSDSKDVLVVDTGLGSKARYEVYRSYDTCNSAAYAKAPGSITKNASSVSTGWTSYQVTGDTRTVHCSDDTGTTIVVVAPDRATLDATGYYGLGDSEVLDALRGELASATSLGSVQTLPKSGWKLSVPYGWTVGEDSSQTAGLDQLTEASSYGTISIERSTRPCSEWTQPSTSGYVTRKTYDPLWLPSGWAATSTDAAGVDFCATVDGASLHVYAWGLYGALPRRLLVSVLGDLLYQNTPQPVYTPPPATDTGGSTYTTPAPEVPYVYTPRKEKKAFLPFPLELSLQTLKVGSDRGWGGRLGVDLGKPLGARLHLGLRGEIAYDNQTEIAYDVGGHLDLRLTPGLSGIGHVGRDQFGTGEETAIEGAFYYGVGGSYGKYFDDGGLDFELGYLWRAVPAEMELDPAYPDHEWRFKGRVFWPGEGRITGLSTEYRTAGDAKTFLLGLRVRL